MELAFARDQRLAVFRIGADQFPFQTQALRKLQCPGFFRDHRIRPAFKEEPVALFGLDDPAQAVSPFENQQLNVQGVLPG